MSTFRVFYFSPCIYVVMKSFSRRVITSVLIYSRTLQQSSVNKFVNFFVSLVKKTFVKFQTEAQPDFEV